jgi:hypothetical protein
MLLTHARVTNFKSIEDSGEFSIGPSACLVGKNEAGKTAILEAIYKLNPYAGDSAYDLQRNYPRRLLAEYEDRHEGKDAQVVQTRWQLTDAELAVLHKLVGKDAVTGREIIIRKHYNQQNTYWTVPVNDGNGEQSAVKYVVASSQLHKEEKEACPRNSIKELKEYLHALGEGASPQQRALLEHLNTAFTRDTAGLACVDALEMPKFVYFSNYNRLRGQVALEELLRKKEENRLDEDDRVFLAFLDLVGTSLEKVANINQFESLISKLESTSTRISREIFSYWSQNRHLKVQIRLDAAQPGDPPPFNSGRIMRTRILNLHHDVSVGFDERSTGFVWFFSFLVFFSQVKKTHGNNLILLLDEPGLSLHAKAQEDLLRYFREKLEPRHQIIYTTHSPFMVPADNLLSVRTVEDIVIEEPGSFAEVVGTKVGDYVLASDRETLFPLQGALGYQIAHTLLTAKDVLLVDGPSDLIYLKLFSEELKKQKRTGLDARWTICPIGGVDKVAAFMNLLNGNRSSAAVLTHIAKGDRKKLEELSRSCLLKEARILIPDAYAGQSEADIEDIIGRRNYCCLVNACYNLSAKRQVEVEDSIPSRIVKEVEAHSATLPRALPQFDRLQPALFLLENRQEVMGNLPDLERALKRFEQLFEDLNALLSAEQKQFEGPRAPVRVAAQVAS